MSRDAPEQAQPPAPQPVTLPAPDFTEKRRHMRYRLVQALVIRRNAGMDRSPHPATTSEISISGLSAHTQVALTIGESVNLSPVGGETVAGIVRRKVGDLYGFEFVEPPDKVIKEIHALCRGLFPFRGQAEFAKDENQ